MKLLSVFLLFGSLVHANPSPDLDQQIAQAAHRFRIDPMLVKAMVEVESAANRAAISVKGAEGLMQMMPKTAEEMGVANAHHAVSNLMGACEYLRGLLNQFDFNLPKVLAAYNAGPHRVRQYRGIPPFRETRQYVRKVLAAYNRLKRN